MYFILRLIPCHAVVYDYPHYFIALIALDSTTSITSLVFHRPFIYKTIVFLSSSSDPIPSNLFLVSIYVHGDPLNIRLHSFLNSHTLKEASIHTLNVHSHSQTSFSSNTASKSSSGTELRCTSQPQDVFNHVHSLLLGPCFFRLYSPQPYDYGHAAPIRHSRQ